jgi:hypothetical protein
MAKAKAAALAENTFEYGGKTFKVLSGAEIPGLGKFTPAEIAVHEEAQKYLVENNCIGTLIEETV